MANPKSNELAPDSGTGRSFFTKELSKMVEAVGIEPTSKGLRPVDSTRLAGSLTVTPRGKQVNRQDLASG